MNKDMRTRLAEVEGLWRHDEQSAWEIIEEVLTERGHDEFGIEDITDLLGSWNYEDLTAEKIARLIEDFEDR